MTSTNTGSIDDVPDFLKSALERLEGGNALRRPRAESAWRFILTRPRGVLRLDESGYAVVRREAGLMRDRLDAAVVDLECLGLVTIAASSGGLCVHAVQGEGEAK